MSDHQWCVAHDINPGSAYPSPDHSAGAEPDMSSDSGNRFSEAAKGQSYHFEPEIKSMHHLMGWQTLIRSTKDQAYLTLHVFDGELPEEICSERDSWEEVITIENGKLRYVNPESPQKRWFCG